ncbi:MAG: alginate lyase family protein [Hyphomicrobiales bacterium]|nr:alginate lyase family protein [Hyphomicrobiales bacterium]
MSPREVLHRVHEMRSRRKLAACADGWAGFRSASSGFPDLQELRAALAAAPMASGETGMRFLGRAAPAGSGPAGILAGDDWFRDPVSGKLWPGIEKSAFAIDVRSTSASPHAARPYGDAKFVLEMNRLQMLQPLALAVAREGAGGPAWGQAMAWIGSWMAANPPYRGVNWSSGIEIALRAASVALVFAAADPVTIPGDAKETFTRFMDAHSRWLAALPSLYSSANNHRVAEGLGLLVCGLMIGDEAHAQEGRTILEQETLLQLHADGVGVEQSPTYQAFTMELIGLGALFAQASGRPFSPSVLTRLGKGVEFLDALLDGSGKPPAIGDDDEGRVLTQPGIDEPCYVASVAKSIGALTGATVMHGPRTGYLREALFDYFRTGEAQPIAQAQVKEFAEGGYTVVNRDLNGRAAHLTFDHGPLGFGSLAAHGHADALALWLSLDDRPVFIDAGTWLYHSGEETRNKLRSSAVHNTLTITGHSQSIPSSAFSWSSKAAARAAPRASSKDTDTVRGEHDGYVKRFGVRHQRGILLSGGDIHVRDMLSGRAGASEVEIAFLCAPDIEIEERSGRLILYRCEAATRETVAAITIPNGFSAQIIRGRDEDARGVYSPRFGELADTSHIVLRGRLEHRDSDAANGPAVTTVLSILNNQQAAEVI